MRISDWSSDVCSSDLRLFRPAAAAPPAGRPVVRRHHADQAERQPRRQPGAPASCLFAPADPAAAPAEPDRHPGRAVAPAAPPHRREHRAEDERSEEHTSELQSLMRISYAVFCLKKKKTCKKSIKVVIQYNIDIKNYK